MARAWPVALLLALAIPASADDTELFVSAASDAGEAGRANILFIIDTSGSMETQVGTQAPWNAATTFEGCFRSDALYFSANGVTPECGSTDFVPKSVNHCEAARSQLDRLGYHAGAYLAWNEEARRWEPLDGAAAGRPMECQADRGIHGGDGTGVYAADGETGPWSADPGQQPGWDSHYTLFDGNWLNWKSNPPSITRTRLEIVQDTVKSLVDTLEHVNVGIMRFNTENGGAVVHPVVPVEDARESIREVVDRLRATDSTPLSETLYEAALYFRGATVDFGNRGPVLSVAESRVGASAESDTYLSPVQEACARNFIILLTDGEPNQDTGATSKVPGLPDFATVTERTACDGRGDGACLDDLAEYLYRGDLDPVLDGQQNVVTHTIGFDLDLPLLARTAQRGGGEYHLANDTASLTTALGGIVLSIFENATSFAAPAVPVSSFTRTLSAGDVYLSVFAPSDRARWPGNLKKYRIAGGEIVGRDGQPVIDPETGQFRSTAWSFWSMAPDGANVAAGGAASRLPEWPGRRVYTDLGANKRDQELATESNRIQTDTAALTAAILGVAETDRASVIEWALGRDVRDADGDGNTTETRRDMGDPLHVQPVSLVYGGTSDSPESFVFVTTNDGFLHAIDGETGTEEWAYIPGELLPRLYTLYRNEPAAAKSYGLDGGLTLHIENDDGEPGISEANGERAILLFGMGRGGRSVYAVDVTRPRQPRLLWLIQGGSGDFADLGQTWAAPLVTRIDTGNGPQSVVVISGGYDSGQDQSGFRESDGIGKAMYIVDLDSGNRIWSAGHADSTVAHHLPLPEMNHSLPAAPRIVDLNQDGLADRMYIGDTGGRLWRFDIVNGESSAHRLVEGGVLASLGAADLPSPGPADARRFYETPDVVPLVRAGQLQLVINIGSGHRGHPLDTTIEDAFFSVRDDQPFRTIPRNEYGPPITVNQLVDVTDDAAPAIPADAAGWRLRLVQGPGEKVLAESVTIQGNLFFTSFTPGVRSSACTPAMGISRLYQVSVVDASPLTNLDASTEDLVLTVEDRSMILNQAAVGLDPVLLFGRMELPTEGEESTAPLSPGTVTVCVAGECRTLPIGTLRRTYWAEDQGI